MWTRAELKENAKIAYKRNYWLCVLVSVIVTAIGGTAYGWYGTSFSVSFDIDELRHSVNESQHMFETSEWVMFKEVMILAIVFGVIIGLAAGICMVIFAGNMATVGGCRYYLENREHKTSILQVFYGFSGGRYKSCLSTMFLRWIIVTAYSFLFIIPGIVKSYAYRLAPYILAENPHMDRKRVLELSESMMKGHKWEAFVFDLSFLGWNLLGALSFGIITVFKVEPYMSATFAEYYTALKSEAVYKGITSYEELPGVGIEVQSVEVAEEC